jgi:hypothetical protein
LSYLLHKSLFKSTNFGGAFSPERASHFEQLKEFQAAQNTTCHLLSANTISFSECLLALLKFSSFMTAQK